MEEGARGCRFCERVCWTLVFATLHGDSVLRLRRIMDVLLENMPWMVPKAEGLWGEFPERGKKDSFVDSYGPGKTLRQQSGRQ